jgi:hypothetical protein
VCYPYIIIEITELTLSRSSAGFTVTTVGLKNTYLRWLPDSPLPPPPKSLPPRYPMCTMPQVIVLLVPQSPCIIIAHLLYTFAIDAFSPRSASTSYPPLPTSVSSLTFWQWGTRGVTDGVAKCSYLTTRPTSPPGRLTQSTPPRRR